MGKRASHGPGGRLSPAARTAVAAALAGAATSCGVIVLWGVLPDARASLALVVLPLILMPLAVAAAAWSVAHRAMEASLKPAVESLERIAAQDFSAPVAPAACGETARLAEALESCRAALAERNGAGKVHAAVARLMGAAIGGLAEGDLSKRITVELPQPYRAFRDDFNAAMEALQARSDELGDLGGRLREREREIGEAAAQLLRRAEKLAERIEAEQHAIEASEDPEEILRRARHMMGGVAVAAQRNIEAAGRFSELGLLVAREAQRLAELAQGPEAEGKEAAARPAESPRMPAADFPARIVTAA